MSTPDEPGKSAEQIALEKRTRMQLNEETASSERRLKAIARAKLGKKSLLGQPIQAPKAPVGPTVTEGYIKTDDVFRKRTMPGSPAIDARASAAGGAIAGADKKSILGGAIGGKSSKKKKLFGGIF